MSNLDDGDHQTEYHGCHQTYKGKFERYKGSLEQEGETLFQYLPVKKFVNKLIHKFAS